MAPKRYRVLGDWGTSRLRLYLADGPTVIERCEGPGIGFVTDTPLKTLRATLRTWLERYPLGAIVLAGMAGSRHGVAETPYIRVPAERNQWLGQVHAIPNPVDSLRIHIAAGLCGTNRRGASDVMRGEETQIFGAIAADPSLGIGEQLLVLPGTHSKWVRLQDGRIIWFDTFITGELFALLRDHSTLLRIPDEAQDQTSGFSDGLKASQSLHGLACALFETRSAQLIEGRSRAWAASFLSGLLIGDEVAAACEGPLRTRQVTIIGDPQLCVLYREALRFLHIDARELDGERCAIDGLLLVADHIAAPMPGPMNNGSTK